MLVPFLLLSTATLASANSRGVGVPCNVDVAVGSEDVMTESAANMWWAKRATWAGSQYTLRTGDGDVAADAISYTPNAWTEIYLRSNEQYKQFTGLVLYAEDRSGNKVGQWSIPAKAPFHKPGDCVVHNNANQKNYLNTFRFSVPPGTGKVTIKALVKYGLANPVKDGAFFWPNNAHLTLTEGKALTDQTWFEGQPGESCDTVCASAGGTCDLDTMLSGAIGPSLYDAVKATTTCTLPLMAGCSGASPSVTDEGCFFHDATCEPPAPEPVVGRDCTQYCSEAPKPHVMNDCCKFKPDRYPVELRDVCMCLLDAQSYDEHNGQWQRGSQPGDTMAPTPPPPEKEQLTCGATIEWNRLARRICACSGARVVAPCSPDEEVCSPAPTLSPTLSPTLAPTTEPTLTSTLTPTITPTPAPGPCELSIRKALLDFSSGDIGEGDTVAPACVNYTKNTPNNEKDAIPDIEVLEKRVSELTPELCQGRCSVALQHAARECQWDGTNPKFTPILEDALEKCGLSVAKLSGVAGWGPRLVWTACSLLALAF